MYICNVNLEGNNNNNYVIVYDYYIFISLLCFNFLYVIFVICLRKKQPTKQNKMLPLPVSKMLGNTC